MDDIIDLLKDYNERVSLKAIETLNLILEKGELNEKDYEKVTDALMEIVKKGMPILSEYAAEGLGEIGAKALKAVRKLIGWLFNLIRSSEDRQVQSAAIAALTEIAYRTEDKTVFNEIFDKMTDLLGHLDPYIQERALSSIDRLTGRAELLTKRNKIKALQKIKEISGNVRTASKANLIMEKLEKLTGEEEILTIEDVRKKLEIAEYGPEDVEKLLDSGKADVVAELAKMDPIVVSKVIELLESEDPTRRADALWVISKIVSVLTPTDAYSILPVLGEFLKSRNPWIRKTAAETMAEIYVLYPGTAQFFTSLLNVLLSSGKPTDTEGALELIYALQKKLLDPEFSKATIRVLVDLIKRKETRGVALKFIAREAQELINMDYEALTTLKKAFKEVYGDEGGKYDNLVGAIIDVVDDLLKLKSQSS
ncbi:HEAT repeat domain-containing protein [Thermococcus gorgonarius]|uniref:HEAT repeat domain-containing protein n=1 Tax=Thermococcus gorgonarius TaxID=71997 RepID=UPI001E4D3B9A|nr:HEAT repeat domain-containing protein [Thermococcus gorgonarius]